MQLPWQAFSEFPLWLAAENGIFMRHTSGEWITTMPEHLNMDWFESVQVRHPSPLSSPAGSSRLGLSECSSGLA